MLSESEFWDRIDYTEEDKKKALFFIKHIGLDYHINVLEYLESVKAGKVSYSEIATTIRYDKRIRRILYKYIGFFEEYIRAYIINKYRDNIDGFSHTKYVENKLNENKSLFFIISRMTFGGIVNQVNILDKEDKDELFCENKYTFKSLNAVRALRNQVGHNRFLLNNYNLQAPIGENGTLRSNLINLYGYLPSELKEKYKEEILNAAKGKETKKEYQTEWYLIEKIAIIF